MIQSAQEIHSNNQPTAGMLTRNTFLYAFLFLGAAIVSLMATVFFSVVSWYIPGLDHSSSFMIAVGAGVRAALGIAFGMTAFWLLVRYMSHTKNIAFGAIWQYIAAAEILIGLLILVESFFLNEEAMLNVPSDHLFYALFITPALMALSAYIFQLVALLRKRAFHASQATIKNLNLLFAIAGVAAVGAVVWFGMNQPVQPTPFEEIPYGEEETYFE